MVFWHQIKLSYKKVKVIYDSVVQTVCHEKFRFDTSSAIKTANEAINQSSKPRLKKV